MKFSDSVIDAVAKAIAKAILVQDADEYTHKWELGPDLSVHYIDQGATEFGTVSRAALTAAFEQMAKEGSATFGRSDPFMSVSDILILKVTP